MDASAGEKIEAICSAMRSRQVVRLQYRDSEDRFVEPHAVVQDQAGKTIVVAWQRGGAAASGRSVGWKYFRLTDIHTLSATADRFASPRSDWDPDAPFLEVSWCKLE